MLHSVLRQRRRFAFALIMTQFAFLGVIPQTWIFLVMVIGIFVAIALISATGLPLRRIVECGSIGLLASTRMPDETTVALTFFGTTLIAFILMYSPLLDLLPIRINLRSRKAFAVNLDQRTVWSKLIPGQGHPAAYWTGKLKAMRPDEHDEDTLYLWMEPKAGKIEEVTVTYLDLQPVATASYLLERDSLLASEEMIQTYHLSQVQDDRTTIVSEMRVSGLPIRHAVERFFDDLLGDELDAFATMTECRRSWSLQRSHGASVTEEMGRENVHLNVDTSDTMDSVERNRMSA